VALLGRDAQALDGVLLASVARIESILTTRESFRMEHALPERRLTTKGRDVRLVALSLFFALVALGAGLRIVQRTGLTSGWPLAELITLFAAGFGAGVAMIRASHRGA
jgi:hypothetical protein